MIQVKLKRHESIEKALKRLKRLMDKEGIMQEFRRRQYFEKPGDKKRRKSARARARKRKELENQDGLTKETTKKNTRRSSRPERQKPSENLDWFNNN